MTKPRWPHQQYGIDRPRLACDDVSSFRESYITVCFTDRQTDIRTDVDSQQGMQFEMIRAPKRELARPMQTSTWNNMEGDAQCPSGTPQ